MRYTFNNDATNGVITTTPFSQSTGAEIRAVDWNDVLKQAYFGTSSGVLYTYSSTGSAVSSLSTGQAINTVSVT
jgi:hypothetical protein